MMGIYLFIWMLYNVLPPIIFFVSLGGIILVVSRVVVRMRRDQVAAELRSHMASVTNKPMRKVQDLAGILGPKQISVQSFKNRISLLVYSVKQSVVKTVVGAKEWYQVRKKQKTERGQVQEEIKSEPKEESDTREDDYLKEGINPPESRYRESFSRLKERAITFSKTGREALFSSKDKIGEKIRNRRERETETTLSDSNVMQEEKEAQKTEQKNTPVLKMVDSNMERDEVEDESQEEDKKKGGRSIGKLFRKEQQEGSGVLEQAKEALKAAEVNRAEDILVPHIVKHPKDTSAYMLLGKAAMKREDWSEAMEIFEQVKSIDPDMKGCYAALGECAYQTGNLTKAIEALQKAHDRNPQDIKVIKYLIKIAARMDNRPMQSSLHEELKTLEHEGQEEKENHTV